MLQDLIQNALRQVISNRTDDFILYAEDKGEKLQYHVGHFIELATYGGKECIAIECTDCNEILYDTATEELQFSDEQQGGMAMQQEVFLWQ